MRTTTDVVRQSSAKIAIILVLLSTNYIDRSGENSLEERQPDFDITSKWREIYSCQSNFRTPYHKRKRIYPSDQCFTRCADWGEMNLGTKQD